MPPTLGILPLRVFTRWLINAACLLALPIIVPAVQISGLATSLVVAMVLGLLYVAVKPVLIVLTLPLTILSFGLFIPIINGALFWLVARFLDDFSVISFGWAVVGAAVYGLTSWAVRELVFGPFTPEVKFLSRPPIA